MNLDNLFKILSSLRNLLKERGIKSVSTVKNENFAMFNLILERLKTYLDLNTIALTVCTGHVKIPSDEEKIGIIDHYHNQIPYIHGG